MNCQQCGKETKNPKFCSSSCSAKKSNIGKVRHGKASGVCLNCEKKLTRSSVKFCSVSCQGKYEFLNESIPNFLNGKASSKSAKRCLIYLHGNVCSKCKNDGMWEDNILILQMDHIDGNRYNNDPSNLRLLCPNCHSQTETWGSSKTYKVSDELFIESLKNSPNNSQALKKIGLAPSAGNYKRARKLRANFVDKVITPV